MRAQDPRTRNPRPQNARLRTHDPKTWDPGTLNFFIEIKKKTLKSKKSLTSKRDKAKHPFTHFNFHVFFSS